jgi:hypothetical protein
MPVGAEVEAGWDLARTDDLGERLLIGCVDAQVKASASNRPRQS